MDERGKGVLIFSHNYDYRYHIFISSCFDHANSYSHLGILELTSHLLNNCQADISDFIPH